MGGLYSQETLSRLQQAADIVRIVSEYFPLKRVGKQFKALCPFHTEKTPSFVVHPDKQFFYCFGCHKGGDVINFVMEIDRLSFQEAVRHLADRAGIVLEPVGQGRADAEAAERRSKLFQVNAWAADTYHQQLLGGSDGERALRYLESRRIQLASASRFRLGYSRDDWEGLLRAAASRGTSAAALEASGLAIPRQSGKGHYDRFRNRLMFPIFDARDRVVGFGARTLGNDQPKYLNTSETELFRKGELLYGLSFARQAASRSGSLCVVEGYTDVVMCHQEGFEATVATLGTALTREHVRLLKRYSDRAVLVYDGDEAGQKASERGLDIFLEEDFEARVAVLPSGMDPCDLLVERGADLYRRVISQAKDLLEYRMGLYQEEIHSGDVSSRVRAARLILESIRRVPDEIKRGLYTRKLADEFGLEEKLLNREVERPQAGLALARSSVASRLPNGPGEKASATLVQLMLLEPTVVPIVRERADQTDWQPPAAREVAEVIFRLSREGEKVEARLVFAALEDSAAREWLGPVLGALERSVSRENRDLVNELEGCFNHFLKVRKERELDRLRRELRGASRETDPSRRQELTERLDLVTRELSEIKERQRRRHPTLS